MRRRAIDRPARLQPPERRQPPRVALVEHVLLRPDERLRAQGHGHVEAAPDVEAEEAAWRHAHDVHEVPVEPQRAADGRGVAAELGLPERVADDRGRRIARAPIVVGGGQQAPGRRLHAEGGEEVAAHPEAAREPRLATLGQIEPRGAPREQVRERLLVGADLLPLRVGEPRMVVDEVTGSAPLGQADANLHEAVGILHRERAQPHGVHRLEDRGVGADAQREREERHEGEAGVEAQQPRAVAQVLPHGFEGGERVHAIDLFAHERDVAELAVRGGARVGRRHAARDVGVGLDLEVGLQLAGPLVVPPGAAQESGPTHDGTSERQPAVGRRMRLMATTSSSHRVVCWTSWRRPAGVSR